MQHARIAVHCQGTTEKSAVQREGGHNFLKNCNCFFGILFILHPNYMNYFQCKLLAISIFENNVIKCFDFPRLYKKMVQK